MAITAETMVKWGIETTFFRDLGGPRFQAFDPEPLSYPNPKKKKKNTKIVVSIHPI